MDSNYNSPNGVNGMDPQSLQGAPGAAPQGAPMQAPGAQPRQSAAPQAPDSDHIYFSPGEPLTPRRPAPEPVQQESAPEQAAPEPYRETPEGQPSPHFTNTRITGADAERIISEAAEADRRNANAATADRSLFANVTLNRGAAPVDPAARGAEKAFAASARSSKPVHEEPVMQAPVQPQPRPQPAQPGPKPQAAPQFAQQAQSPQAAPAAQEPAFTAGEAPASMAQHAPRRPHAPSAASSAASKALVSALLYLRQLGASFFTHTILGTLFPRAGSLMGPCFPSSMPVPFFVMGFITALPVAFMPLSFNVSLGFASAIATAIFVIMDGVAGFRGISSLLSAASRTRTGGSFEGAVSATCIMLLWSCLCELGETIPGGPELALASGAVFMLSALAGCTLSFGSDPDPVDSYGTMSVWGLLFSLVLTLAVLFLCLPPLAATSFFGLALLIRLAAGYFMGARGMLPSRDHVNAVQMLTLLVLLVYMTAASALHAF
jgi:hypothetical protein